MSDTLVGTDTGLYIMKGPSSEPLWTDGGVQKILKAADRWYFLTTEGVFSSTSLLSFESCNQGLPFNVIKEYSNKTKTFVRKTQGLKDLEIHPENPEILVTATKDAVFLTRDAGKTWKNLGLASRTSGVKAVAVANLLNPLTNKSELIVFMSHAINGLFYCMPDNQKIEWIPLDKGFEAMPTVSFVDEISDILAVNRPDQNGQYKTSIYLSQTFRPRLYELDWAEKKGTLLWAGQEPLETIDGLFYSNNSLLFTMPNTIAQFNLNTKTFTKELYVSYWWSVNLYNAPGNVQCAMINAMATEGYGDIFLSELWLLKPGKQYSKYAQLASNRKGLYIPVNQVRSEKGLGEFINLMNTNGLDSAVIDMKDDYGLLKYDSKDPLVLEKATLSNFRVELDSFVKGMKAHNKYLIARIVVFKDRNLWRYSKNEYAVVNKAGVPWQGIRSYTKEKDEEGNETGNTLTEYYDEFWVDPYSEEVWEYNIAIARELLSRGFDEIQFDYIRFPTDGLNMNEATYRWREQGMDMESALISFLSYARKNLDAPIGIDIYGANGWYRTGARTGQDVELLTRFVDIICPMFYPSHFEQTFLAQTPAEERPYRIYFYGTYRNAVISRNHSIIRPWTQAFYLNVAYDRKYYNPDYVAKQVFGVRDSLNQGYMHWNNGGRYEDIRPDPSFTQAYPWTAFEADRKFRKPALGGR